MTTMSVSEFREWLKQFSDDTFVEVIVDDQIVKFTATDNQFDFVDFTKNSFVDEKEEFFGKKYLTLGAL